MDIKKIILHKWFFPKIIITNYPGIIITRSASKYGNKNSMNRLSYCFEEVYVNLQKETIKEVGIEKTKEMWYKIGKESIARHLLGSDAKKPPYLIAEEVLEFIIKQFFLVGLSVGSNIKINKKRRDINVIGKNNIIHRKSKIGEHYSGGISELVSFIFGENIEAETNTIQKEEGIYLEIRCNKKMPLKYKPNHKEIKEDIVDKEKRIKDLRKIVTKVKDSSFNKMLKFKKIKIKENITFFRDDAIVMGGYYSSEQIFKIYNEEKLKEVLEKSLEKSSKEIIKKYLTGEIKKDIKFILEMLSVFGWGIFDYKMKKDEFILETKYFSSSKSNSFNFYVLQIIGYLSTILKKQIKIKKIIELNKKELHTRIIFK